MRKELINWSKLHEDRLTEEDMIKIRGGNDSVEDPNGPIIK